MIAQSNANADRREDLFTSDRKRRCEGFHQSVGGFLCVIGIFEILEEHREFIAAESCHGKALPKSGNGVTRSERFFQATGDTDQQLIAGEVAETVVDHFESIEIEEQHGKQRVFAAPDVLDRSSETIDE